MSTYIIDDKVINNFLSYLILDNGDLKRRTLNFYGLEEISGHEKAYMEILGGNMMLMNIKAVSERYTTERNYSVVDKYKFIFNLNVTRLTALKNLSNWLYQCAEGDVFKSKEYKFFEILKGEIAMEIVRDMKEYELID